MNIYVAHASSYNFVENLYAPLKASKFWSSHHFILPHEYSMQVSSSMKFIKEADFLLAEVSYPSTGLGIELGWANAFGTKVFCICQVGAKLSTAISCIVDHVYEYENEQAMLLALGKIINTF